MKLKMTFVLLAFAFWACDEGEEKVDCSLSGLTANQIALSAETCAEGGMVEFEAEGGQAPYDYSINEVSFKSSGAFQNLSEGTYTLTVRDDNQCMITQDFTISSEVPAISVSADVTQAAGCGGNAGIIEVAAEGGSGAFSYQIDGTDFGSGPILTEVPNGNHTLSAIDEEGCSGELDIYVDSGISYSASVAEIIETNCAITDCHVAGNSIPDFTSFVNIQSNASKIKELTENGSMPRNSEKLSDAEIEAIACWVDDGALDN